jgi:NAD(P)-dependent dehydrogenase (short-subunit alcohol dehydrogenase family)
MAETSKGWGLILGASSGFGAATSIALAKAGYDIFGVHLDRKTTLPLAEKVHQQVKDCGRDAMFFNVNAADAEKRAEVCNQIDLKLKEQNQPGQVKVLLHSLAFGTLKPLIGPEGGDFISQPQMDMTLDVMANSLVYWVQDIVRRKLMGPGGRIYAMTSSGGKSVLPSYGAVSAAKAALESHIRQLALELAPYQITTNSIRAGVTDTPALRKIPGGEHLLKEAAARNPYGRTTTPEDVAACIATLADATTHWMSGNVIGVDGGEDVVGATVRGY